MRTITVGVVSVVLVAAFMATLVFGCTTPADGARDVSTTTPSPTTSPAPNHDWVAYVKFGSGYLPVSYIVQGKQLLVGGCECEQDHAPYDCATWYDWAQTVYAKTADAPLAEEITRISATEWRSPFQSLFPIREYKHKRQYRDVTANDRQRPRKTDRSVVHDDVYLLCV